MASSGGGASSSWSRVAGITEHHPLVAGFSRSVSMPNPSTTAPERPPGGLSMEARLRDAKVSAFKTKN